MALQSGVKSELAWALNVLALASCSGATPLELRHHPDLLPLLLNVTNRIAVVVLTLVCQLASHQPCGILAVCAWQYISRVCAKPPHPVAR
jgi:hypothetical protein